jgi:hypothetical protein
MTEQTTARVAPPAEGAQLTEHVNVLLTEETRAFLLGSKQADGARSEGAVARALLVDAIRSYELAAPDAYAERVQIGRVLLEAKRTPQA